MSGAFSFLGLFSAFFVLQFASQPVKKQDLLWKTPGKQARAVSVLRTDDSRQFPFALEVLEKGEEVSVAGHDHGLHMPIAARQGTSSSS